MQGIYILPAHDLSPADRYLVGMARPASKKAIAQTIATDPDRVVIEATSLFGGEYSGPASTLPAGAKIYFVGPSPHQRKFYGTIERDKKTGALRVK